MECREITQRIIGCAYRVYNTMGFGFLESVYEKCLLIELTKAGLDAKTQVCIPVMYDNQSVGDFTAALVVEGKVIVELKSVMSLAKAHEIQLVNYLSGDWNPGGITHQLRGDESEVKRKVRKLTN